MLMQITNTQGGDYWFWLPGENGIMEENRRYKRSVRLLSIMPKMTLTYPTLYGNRLLFSLNPCALALKYFMEI
jgi:hypothetical protein